MIQGLYINANMMLSRQKSFAYQHHNNTNYDTQVNIVDAKMTHSDVNLTQVTHV